MMDDDGDWGDGDWGADIDYDRHQSKKDTRNLSGFEAHPPDQDWLKQNRADRAARAAKRAAEAQARRAAKRNESSGDQQRPKTTDSHRRATPGAASRRVSTRRYATHSTDTSREAILRRSLTEAQPGQHGAFFERREVRCWYAPWKKRYRWQQISAWMSTTPPRSGTEVVSVGSLDELDGRVRTIGTVGENGTVVY
jgi:hypothetical protein